MFSYSRVQLILCKDYANERKASLLAISRVQLILCKDTKNNVYKKKRKHGGYEQPYFPMIKNTIREFYFKRLFDQILLVLYYVDSRL